MSGGIDEVWLVLRGVAALVFVTALAVLLVRFGLPWLLRHRSATRRTLEVEEALPLGRNHTLYVVRWNDEHVLVGSSPGRLDRLGTRSAPPPEPEESSEPTFERALEQHALRPASGGSRS